MLLTTREESTLQEITHCPNTPGRHREECHSPENGQSSSEKGWEDRCRGTITGQWGLGRAPSWLLKNRGRKRSTSSLGVEFLFSGSFLTLDEAVTVEVRQTVTLLGDVPVRGRAPRATPSSTTLLPECVGGEVIKVKWWGKGRTPQKQGCTINLPSPVDARSPGEQGTQNDKRKVHVIRQFHAPLNSKPSFAPKRKRQACWKPGISGSGKKTCSLATAISHPCFPSILPCPRAAPEEEQPISSFTTSHLKLYN